MKRFLLFFVAIAFVLVSPAARGQILYTASMDPSQESPATASRAQGTAWLLLGADLNTITYGVTYAHLDTTFTAGHFHIAPPGVAGPVVFPLTFNGNTANGTWSGVPDSVVRALLRGDVYVNVHSAKYPAGEIRGQFKMVSGAGFTINLTGAQVMPPKNSAATGTGWAWLEESGRVHYRVTVAGLNASVTGADFRGAASGSSGPVILRFNFNDSTASDSTIVWEDAALVYLLKGNTYVSVYTGTDTAAQIRGQLVQANGVRLAATLDATGVNPPANSKAQATGWGILNPGLTSLTYRVTGAGLDSALRSADFHIAPWGITVHGGNFKGNTAQGTFSSIPDTLLLALFKGNLSASVSTAAYPNGEIKGAITILKGVGFTISMDANQEVPPTGTGAAGTGVVLLDSSGTRLQYRATIAGLSDSLTASHFHSGPPGVAGPVVHPISFTDSTTQGTWSAVPDSIVSSLLKGNIYMNVHSKAHPGGEIRGQLLYRPALSTGIEPVAGSSVPTSFRLEQNYPNPFNPSTAIEFQLSQASHVSLKVFNLLGQEVATLVNDVKQAGVYRVTFDAGKLASGVYFYRLATDNGLVASKKMLLLK